jgi:hypothetical protein
LNKITHREYLLGGLTQEERETIAEEYFSSDEAFDAIMDAERDLLDSYVRGALSHSDKQRMERVLLTSESQLQKLAIAKALSRLAEPSRSFYLRYLPYAAIALVGVGLSVQYFNRTKSAMPAPVASKQSASPFVMELAANTVRGGNALPSFAIPPAAEMVRIRFEAAEQDGVLSAELLTSGGASIWQQSGILAKAGIASLDAPASVLRSGSFELYLRDARGNTTGYFPFQIK